MPLYPYRCTQCGYRFEKIQSFSAEPEKVCPNCGKSALERQLTAPAFQFKGAGWYVNDYSGKSSAPESNSPSAPVSSGTDSAASESKSAPAATPAAPASPASGTAGGSSAS